MSPRIPMKNRVIRVSDADWEAAMNASRVRGENLSEKIREFIRVYGQEKKEEVKK